MQKTLGILLAIILLFACAALAEQEPEWVYSFNQGGIGRYNGPGGAVTVPEVVEDHPVLALGDAVFQYDDALTSLTVPGCVLSLGSNSIAGCANLTSVTLNEGLQSIEYNTFSSCKALTELTIPASVVAVDYAISWCDNLRKITFLGECPQFIHPDFCLSVLPDDLVVYVPDDQLEAYHAALVNLKPEQVQPSGQNAVVYSWVPQEEEFSFDASSGTLTAYNGESLRVDLPAEIGGVPVTAIGQYAFEDSPVVIVNIPEGVTEIGSMAFESCYDLQVVRMPDSLKKIGSHAFDGIEGTMVIWGQGLEEIGDGAFRYADLGTPLELPSSLRVIGREAFYRASLRDMHIGPSIEKIGVSAFQGTNLNYIELDAYSMIDVGEDAFAGTYLEDIDLPWDSTQENQQAWQALIDGQVEGCKVWINNPADCELPTQGSVSYEAYPDGTLYASAYEGSQENLVMYHTMDGVQVTGLGDGVFKGNQTLKKYRVTHNDTFTTIGAEAFAGSAVEVVDLYYTTEQIGAGAFRDCLGLTEITLPASLKSVGDGAFAGCANLKTVNILCDPAILPEDAFEGTAYAAVPVIEMPMAANAESDFEFDAETGAITAYLGDAVDVVIPREIGGVPVRVIRQNAFARCQDYTDTEIYTNQTTWQPLRSVVIPETVETIEDSAFEYCQQLELVICYAPLQSTGRATFLLCRGLTDVLFVNGVKEIDNYAFESCTSLQHVYWGDHLQRIGVNAFNRCGLRQLVIDAKIVDEGAFNHSALQAVTLTDRVKEVHSAAFWACENLTYFACQFSEADRFVDGGPTGGIPQEGVTTLFPDTTTDEQLRALNAKFNIWNGGHLGSGNEIALGPVEASLPKMPDPERLYIELMASSTIPTAPTPEPAQPVALPDPIADINTVMGEWKLTLAREGGQEFDASMFGGTMILTLNPDGTAQSRMDDYEQPIHWKLRDGVLFIGDESEMQAAGLDEQGRLVMLGDGLEMVFDRVAGEIVAPAETPEPEIENDGSADLTPYVGTWYAILIDAGVEPIDAHGLDFVLEIGEDGIAYSSDAQKAMPLRVVQGIVSFDYYQLTLREDGRLMMGDPEACVYYSRDPQDIMPLDALATYQPIATDTPAPAPISNIAPGEYRTNVKYLAVSYVAAGVTVDASALPEYAITLYEDGTCDFIMGGFGMPGMIWSVNGDGTLLFDYMGALQYNAAMAGDAMEIDMNGMIMHYEPQE